MPRDEPAEAAALSSATAIVATSQWTKRWLGDSYGLPAGSRACRPARRRSRPTWRRARRPGGRLLCVGAVTPVKGQDVLLDALASVEDLAWRCVCVGALDIDPEFAADVRRQTGGRGLGRSGALHRCAHRRRAERRLRAGGRPRARLACRDLRHGRHRGARPGTSGHRHRRRRRARGPRSRGRRQPARPARAAGRPACPRPWRCGGWLDRPRASASGSARPPGRGGRPWSTGRGRLARSRTC